MEILAIMKRSLERQMILYQHMNMRRHFLMSIPTASIQEDIVQERLVLFWLQSTLTRVVAQKIIQDTGTEPNISITQEELDTAMDSEPEIPMPVMEQHIIEELGMNISYPYLWNLENISEEGNPSYMLYCRYEDNNIWDMSILRLNLFTPESGLDLQIVKETLESDGYDIRDTTINELPGVRAVGQMINNDRTVFIVIFPKRLVTSSIKE